MKANRASATARLIAAATVMRDRQNRHGGAPPAGAAAWCEQFLGATRTDRFLLRSISCAVGRAGWRFAESMCVPGIVSHWMRRKREIDRLARQAAADGFEQLIVLGAGLDSLAFRMSAERVFATVISADHPATLAVVRAATSDGMQPRSAASRLAAAAAVVGAAEPGSVELLELDLMRDDVGAVLSNSRCFNRSLATLVVIEGVLMYLPESGVARVLHSLAVLPGPRRRLIASWMLAGSGQLIGFRGQSRLVEKWLGTRREPMLWASTTSALPPFLAGLGWNNVQLIDLAERDSSGQAGSGGLSSERLVVAEG